MSQLMSQVLYYIKMNILFDVGMAVGPVMGYIHQYRLIHISQNIGTFSIDICGILLFANVMRLNFYLFKRYELALVFQSIIMITVQLLLLKLCAQLPLKTIEADMAHLKSAEPEYKQKKERFWRWTQFHYYFITVLLFALTSFLCSLVFYWAGLMAYGEIVGLVSLSSESVLIAPQILKNFKMGRVKGLSHLMVVLNLSGDIIKLIYFIVKSQPFQFVMCGIIQIILDSTVIAQILYYKKKAKKRIKSDKPPIELEQKNNSVGEMQLATRQLAFKISEVPTQVNLDEKEESPEPEEYETNDPTMECKKLSEKQQDGD